MTELIDNARDMRSRPAVTAPEGTFTYQDLLTASAQNARRIRGGGPSLGGARVAMLIRPGFRYAAMLWGIWRAGGVAVPLAVNHPAAELEYHIEDSGASILAASPDLADRVAPVARKRGLDLIVLDRAMEPDRSAGAPLDPRPDQPALMVYTSGTTGRPKGVVLTVANLEAQVRSMIKDWGWTPADRLLHALPLHHVHGIVNALITPLAVGARVEIMPRFDAAAVLERIARGDLTLFFAVPTMYHRLIAAWHDLAPDRKRAFSQAAAQMRLMISGSAALPVKVLEQWRDITGHTLLERYGMTEIGMALSNPLDGPRVPGAVGRPMPLVEARITAEGREAEPGQSGELWIKGPTVFHEYWNRPHETEAAFEGQWFKTGDAAVVEDGVYRILGRNSVDIIKTGGYKVSALEIEEVIRRRPDVDDVAVVGVEDEEWGQRVAAAVTLRPERSLTLEELREWAKELLAPYKIPTRLMVVDRLPRNAMGKVTKTAVADWFAAPNHHD
jgi:malonyl-CoA/methylmalonyl-CoA synthetase